MFALMRALRVPSVRPQDLRTTYYGQSIGFDITPRPLMKIELLVFPSDF
jgi:hypothetical protein